MHQCGQFSTIRLTTPGPDSDAIGCVSADDDDAIGRVSADDGELQLHVASFEVPHLTERKPATLPTVTITRTLIAFGRHTPNWVTSTSQKSNPSKRASARTA